MKHINEGDLYNQEQINSGVRGGSEQGLKIWKQTVRQQLMQHLKGKSSEEIEKIIQATFGHILD